MEIQPVQSTERKLRPFARWGLKGSAVALMISLPAYIMSIAVGWVPSPILPLGIGILAGGGIPLLWDFLSKRQGDPLGRVERELRRARGLMEQHLIDEEDYERIKSHVLEHYRLNPPNSAQVWERVFWGAFTGLIIPAIVLIVPFPPEVNLLLIIGVGTMAAGAVTGGAAQVYTALLEPDTGAQLPAPSQRRMLGE